MVYGRSGRLTLVPALLLLAASAAAVAQRDELASDSQRAKRMMEAGRYDEAVPLYLRLVKAIPGNSGLLLNLGLAQHMAGREREAIPNLEAVVRAQPRLTPALIALGAARLSLDQPQQAVSPLRKAVAIQPENPDARGMLAQALGGIQHFDEAAEQFRKLTELARQDPRAWYGLGASYESIAGGAFDRLRSQGADSPYVAALIADTRVQRHQYNSAFFFYREALKQLPGLHGVHAALADVYRKTGHPDWGAAEDGKERALPAPDCMAHPAECQFIGGHDLQAIKLTGAGKAAPEVLYWQAKAANELALQAFFTLGNLPPSVELHRLRAEIARNHNQHLEAVKEWRAALALSPGDPGLKQELAVSLFMAQDFRGAIEEAAPLLAADSQSPELNFVTGDSYLRLEEPGKAAPHLQTALVADPKLLAAHASLGLALSRLDKSGEAIPHLEKALPLDDDGNLHYQLARAYQASGEREKAREAMTQYQRILKTNREQKAEAAREAQIAPPQ
ncbi:MAG: tetratricopeptide repeat protein [Acidobacteriota bacterium]|nr:tetratricopeptide repeat protein [Acidobacteriota bacterium]